MQSVNFILCCANLDLMNEKLLLHGHMFISQDTNTKLHDFWILSATKQCETIKIKQKLLFFQAEEYISRVFGLCRLNKVIFFSCKFRLEKRCLHGHVSSNC